MSDCPLVRLATNLKLLKQFEQTGQVVIPIADWICFFEALTFLTSPATVTVRIGSVQTVCNAPAGVSTCLAPIGQPGPEGLTVSAFVSRDERSVVTLVSPYKIVADPPVQDLSYAVSESGASGS